MKTLSAFDVIGPRMVGPSSSHTAGAARLAKVASRIAGPDIVDATFTLFGSFGQTYRGHGTDRALLAGVMGLEPDDERLPDAFALADERGLTYRFIVSEAETAHPNTVLIQAQNRQGMQTHVMGVSIGGGSVLITNINGVEVELTGEYPTLIVHHMDRPGLIADTTRTLVEDAINIAYMSVFRKNKGGESFMVIETDQTVPRHTVERLQSLRREILGVHVL